MFETATILKRKLGRGFGQLPWLARGLALAWRAGRTWTIVWLLLLIFQGSIPVGIVYLTKLLVDALVATAKYGALWPQVRTVLTLVAILAGLTLLAEIVRTAIGWIRTVQAELLQDHINDLIHEKSVAADLAFYEFPDYYDHLHRARAEAGYRPVALLENVGNLLQNSVTLLAMGAVLAVLGPWLAVALLISTLPAFWVVVHYSLVNYQWRHRTTADERRARYYDWLMTTPDAAAELRLFSLGQHFRQAYKTLRTKLRTERIALAKRASGAELAAATVALLITGLALAWTVWGAAHGLITLGELALIYGAFNQGQRLLRSLLEHVGQVYTNSLFIKDLFEFLALKPLVADPPAERAQTVDELAGEVCFRDVSFRYPQSERRVLDDFNLKVRPGQIAAIVGPNGAGKSTLIKLLCRFYDPDCGEIELDGINVRDVPAENLRQLMTVLFQQPVHFNATVKENVEFGDLMQLPQPSEVEEAVRAAGAEEIVARLPSGFDSLLGKWFVGGVELSTGEWQRIALARAFLRRAPVIILDEPTSALDPWAEADWLQRFRSLAAGRTAIIITHRLTTAMHADVIHVVEQGSIVESGDHYQLLRLSGRYAELWATQTTATGEAFVANS